jgi:peptidoglycan-associated lipoprotein
MTKKNSLRNSAFIALFGLLFLYGCGGGNSFEKAKKYEDAKKYFDASQIYKKIYSSSKDKNEKALAAIKASETFKQVGNIKEADKWLNNAIKQNSTAPEVNLMKAKVFIYNELYTDALKSLNDYKKESKNDTMGDYLTGVATNGLKWKKEKSKYIVENLKVVNTKFFDFAPAVFKKDLMIFTSDREGGINKTPYSWTGYTFSDFYKSERNKKTGNWGSPILIKDKLNTKFNDGSGNFDSKGVFYCTQCNGKKGEGMHCNIYQTELKNKDWDEPELLPFNNDSLYDCSQPCPTPDGQILFFSSNMPGGIGGHDIWFVTYSKKSKTWSDPINAGPAINTPKDEVYPWIHNDGTMFFSSNGKNGMGGMDIYSAIGQGKDWSEVKNMKAPINSGADDFAFSCDDRKESGFLTSNRVGGKGNDDIYTFKMAPLEICLVGTITDCKTNEPLANAIVTVTNSIDTSRIILKTDAKGGYKTKCNLKPNAEYSVYAQKREDYYFDSKVFDISTMGIEVSTTLRQDMCLKQIDIKEVFTVKGILYDLDRAEIRPDAALILDSLVLVMKKYAKITIELGSHTDCRASYAYNIDLSQRRADSAVAYIINHGIDKERLTARGYGETQLVNDCACEGEKEPKGGKHAPFEPCSEDLHQLNRRTTVKVTGMNYISKK